MFKKSLLKLINRRGAQSAACVYLLGLLTWLGATSVAQSYLFNKADFGVGTHPTSVVAADFNGDGKTDLAIVNGRSNTISVLLGKTDGTFQPHVDYDVGDTPLSVTVGDLNADGKLDLAVANLFGNTVSILLGRGDGTFQTHVDYAAGPNPTSVAAGDFNGDGKLDLVITNETTNTVSILLGNGHGTFTSPMAYPTGNAPEGVVIKDFNGDGKLDLATANHFGNSVSILLGNGDGTFKTNVDYPTDPLVDSIAVGDFNGDGKLDLAVGTDVGTVDTLLGNGDGTFQPFLSFGPGRNLSFLSLTIADFNGDGKADIAAATPNGVAIAIGNGDGTFQPILYYAAGGEPGSVTTADINGDGNLDLAIANQECPSNPCNPGTVSVLLGNGDGTFMSRDIYPTTTGSVSLTNADLNGDGILDLVTANGGGGNTVSVYLGKGDGTFLPHVDYLAGGNPYYVIAADFRANGSRDLAVPNAGGNSVSVLPNNGDGTFQNPVQYAVGSSPTSIAVGDFNGDGHLDMAVTTLYPSVVSILLGNGDGTFRSHVDYALAANSFPNAIVIGDFNGDNKLDLAAAETSGVSILLGNGDGTFKTYVNYPTGFSSASVAVGDFNGDGRLDLASTSSGANASGVSILLGNGDGTFQPYVNYSSGLAFGQVMTGDFNGDGKLDVAAAGGDASILLGNGDGTLQSALHILPVGFFTVTAGDFEGNHTLALAGIDGFVDASPPSLIVALNRAVVALFPTELAFPTRVVGTTSGRKEIQVSNPGAVPLEIKNITASAPYIETNNCPHSPIALAPGTQCIIRVKFSPKSKGVAQGAITIIDNALSSLHKVGLTGTGTFVQLAPSELNFGTQPTGTQSLPKRIVLTNKGDVTVNITKISITGVDAGDFSETNNCGHHVASGASCIINVTFKPLMKGKRKSNVSLYDDGGGSPQQAGLMGTGT